MINSQKLINQNTIEDLREQIYPKELMYLSGVYDGIVTRCIDKNKPGWIKVSIYGVTDDLPLKDQPWAEPPPTQNFQVPDPGSYVLVTFRDGDIHYPIWQSVSSQANGRFFPSHEHTQNYPNNHIIYNSGEGTVIKNNRKTGKLDIDHSSGTKITIDKSGDVEVSNESIKNIAAKKYKVVTGAAQCPFLASIGAPPAHPCGLAPILSIDDIGIP